MSTAPPPSAPGKWSPALALLVASTMFMEQLDGTILVTALPKIAADFGVGSADVNITMTAYLITVAAGIPLGGWLAGRFGARRIYCTAIVAFTLASLLCALSTSLPMLTAGRVLQGFGGAMMVPVGRLVVLQTTEKKDLMRAIAYITWPALLAPVLAPVVGGVITTYLSWHWIFLINLPLGVVAMVLALRLVPDTGKSARAMDWYGLLWVTVTVTSLIAGMELVTSPEHTLTAAVVLVFAVLAGTGAVRWLLQTSQPLIDLRIFRVPTFRVTNSGGFIYRLVINSMPFLLPLMFQDGFGFSPVQSGLLVAAVFLGNVGIKPTTTPLLRRFGFKTVLTGAITGIAVTFALCAALGPQLPLPVIFVLLVASGAFRSIGFTAYNTIQFADVAREQLPSANTLSATVSEFGAAMGIAAGALLLRLAHEIFNTLGSADPLMQYRGAFLAMALLSLVPLTSALRLPPGAGLHVSGGRAR